MTGVLVSSDSPRRRQRNRFRKAAVCTTTALSLALLAACSSSSSGSGSSTVSTSTAASATASAGAASGAPINVGAVETASGSYGDPLFVTITSVWEKWTNAHGGINGDEVHGVAVDAAVSVSPFLPDTRDGDEEGIAV